MSKNKNVDIIRLGASHALILGNLPEPIQLSQLNKILEEQSTADIASFGFFESSSPNYTTYYPDVKPEDLKPSEAEFINPVFRALSKVIVHKKHNPIDFGSNDALAESMALLKGQTVNVDHETMTGNAIGAVSEVSWEESYKVGSLVVPAGINSILHIDGKSNPRIARAINSDPPSIHSASVTVEFEWEPSHPKISKDDFFTRLGTLDDKGVMIRRVVTKVKRYHEISLVNHGADPFAQLIKKDGKINNAKYAHISYNSEQEASKGAQYFHINWKEIHRDEGLSGIIMNSTIPNEPNNTQETEQKSENMNKTSLLALAALLGIQLSFAEGTDELDSENQTKLMDAIKGLQNSTSELTTKLEEAIVDKTKLTALSEFKSTRITELREKVINTCKLCSPGDKAISEKLLNSINNCNEYEALEAMLISYEESLEEKIPITCGDCGSQNVSRASAEVKDEDTSKQKSDETKKKPKVLSNQETMAKLRQVKSLPIGMGFDEADGEA